MSESSFTSKDHLLSEASTSKTTKNKRRSIRKCISAGPSRSRRDILPPLDPNFKTKAQLDVDPKYYSQVEGRPIKPNQSIRLYKDNIRNITISRVTRGFVLEEILRIDEEYKTEKTAFEVALRHFEGYKKSFETFLADDNDRTMTIIKQCDNTAKELALTTDQHKKWNYETAALRSKLQYIDESRMILISYEKFLHKISPLWWQIEHNVAKYDQPAKSLIVITSDIFSKMNPEAIQTELDRRPEPSLFFERPVQLPLVFEMLEKQNLNYLLMTEEMNAHLMKVFKGTEYLRKTFEQEISIIQEEVNIIEDAIAWTESREDDLKNEFYKILKDNLEHLIASETALQLYCYVEYVYEHVISENNVNQSTVDMVHALEIEYKDMMFKLDEIDLQIVKEIQEETFTEDVKVLKEAERAKNLLKNFDKIRKRLSAAYDPYERRNNLI